MTVNSSEGNLKLLLSLRQKLYDAIRDEDCPQKDRASITLQFRKNEEDITELDNSFEQMKTQYDMFTRIQAVLTDAVDNAAYTYLATLTRQLKAVSKDVDTLAEQLKHEGGIIDGGASADDDSRRDFNIDEL